MYREREEHQHIIPDLEIIDLEQEDITDDTSTEEKETPDKKSRSSGKSGKKGHFPRLNMHIVLLIVFVIFVCGIAYKILNFGKFVDLEEIFRDGKGTYEDTLDEILPLMDADGKRLETNYEDGLTIVAFGNAPFADDRDSDDSLAGMIEEMTGATVYNCSISGSYLASQSPFLNASESPMDAFTFYWLAMLSTGSDIILSYNEAKEVLGEDLPPDAEEVINTLTTLDFSTVDVIAILYDATDYLLGHQMYSDQNSTDIEQFTGNLEAGIEVLQDIYPHIRIIVMSPPYAYSDQLDEKGNYISSDIARYGQDVLSTYVIKEFSSCASRSVTFIDNLYGTITEDNAHKYLIDNLHLNTAGRKEIAKRFVYALNYYNQKEDGHE
ncbi:MAG: SGNH/GDSL hydrolase family protein [Acetatifactor sp.]|nr:SGNH/GDSL hydrolase family protein [Acetatifactor sp.]